MRMLNGDYLRALPPGLPGVRQAYPPYQIFGLPPGLPGARLPSDMYGLAQAPGEHAIQTMPGSGEMKAAASPGGDIAAAILVFLVSGTIGAFVANFIGFMGAGLGTAVAPINVRMRR